MCILACINAKTGTNLYEHCSIAQLVVENLHRVRLGGPYASHSIWEKVVCFKHTLAFAQFRVH